SKTRHDLQAPAGGRAEAVGLLGHTSKTRHDLQAPAGPGSMPNAGRRGNRSPPREAGLWGPQVRTTPAGRGLGGGAGVVAGEGYSGGAILSAGGFPGSGAGYALAIRRISAAKSAGTSSNPWSCQSIRNARPWAVSFARVSPSRILATAAGVSDPLR